MDYIRKKSRDTIFVPQLLPQFWNGKVREKSEIPFL